MSDDEDDEKTREEKEAEAKAEAAAAFAAAMPAPGAPLMAARVGDPHICPMVNGLVPHVGGPILKGQPNVLIGGMPAARVSDTCTCTGPPDVIVKGSATVLIGGMPAARMMDQTAHGGMIVMGCPLVTIGG
jgi:uncharacterized Zn-binding protein involved in type VI secretion